MQDFLKSEEQSSAGLGRKQCLIVAGACSDWQEAHAKPPAGFFRSVMTDARQPEAVREILKAGICKNNFS